MNKRTPLLWVVVSLAAAVVSPAQQKKSTRFHAHAISPRVYWVDGNSNSGFIIGNRGVIVFDAKMTEAEGKALLAEIALVTPKPVEAVILSHSDLDHVGGIAAFPKGIPVIAHQNMIDELQADPTDGGHGNFDLRNLPNSPVMGFPTKIILDGVQLQLLHWAPAHSSGDIVLFLPEESVVFAGDMMCLDFPGPLILVDKHGTASGWLYSFRGVTHLDADTFVPGHGNPQSKVAVESMLASAQGEYDNVRELVARGESLPQVEAAPENQQRPPGAATYRVDNPTFSQVAFRELTKEADEPRVVASADDRSQKPAN